MALRRRGWTALWVIGVILLAAGAGLGSRTAQTHVIARKAWLAASDRVGTAGYDAAESDALYVAAEEALETMVLLTRIAGAGLVLILAGVLGRRERAPMARGRILRGSLVAAAAALVWGALAFAAASVTHPLVGPLVANGLRAIAPFAAAAAAIAVWLLHRSRTAAKVPASNGDNRR